jgi:hypothetical protein
MRIKKPSCAWLNGEPNRAAGYYPVVWTLQSIRSTYILHDASWFLFPEKARQEKDSLNSFSTLPVGETPAALDPNVPGEDPLHHQCTHFSALNPIAR